MRSPADAPEAGRARSAVRPHPADLAWLGLLAALAAWAGVVTVQSGGAPAGTWLVLAVLAGAWLAGRGLAATRWWLPSVVLVAAGAVIAIRDRDVLLDGPLSSPLGYSNATGGLYLLVAAGALLLVARARSWLVRAPGLVAFVAAAAVPWGNGTDTAALLVLAVPLGLLAWRGPRWARTLVAVAGAAVVLALAVTVWLGATYDPEDRGGAVDALVDATLSERRPQLWHDALVLLAGEPLTGVGPGGFSVSSTTARADADASWAHQEWLHLGAETGTPGLGLGLALLATAFARLWWGPGDAGTAVAALGLMGLAVQASIDYVLHFPEVAAAGALLVAAGGTRRVPGISAGVPAPPRPLPPPPRPG